MNPIESIVRKHIEAMHDQLGEYISEENDMQPTERYHSDGLDFATNVTRLIQSYSMTRSEYADWWG